MVELRNKIICNIVFFLIFSLHSDATSIVPIEERYEGQDLVEILNYLENEKNLPVEEIEIKDYIINKINHATDNSTLIRGFELFLELTNEHQKFFDDFFIEFIESEVNKDTFTMFNETGDRYAALGMVSLGHTRTQKSIDYLLKLIDPIENWPVPIQQAIINHEEVDDLIPYFRHTAIEAIIEPYDEVVEGLMPTLREYISTFSDEKPHYLVHFKSYRQAVKDMLDRWEERYYSSSVDEAHDYY